MFSAINLNINIVRLKSPQKCLTFYLFCFLPSLIPTVKASIVDIIQFPIVDGMSHTTLTCPTDKFSKFVTYDTFGSQTGAFIPILGLLFTVAVYGTTSVFGYMTTCLLDDIVIFTSSLAPILSWYTLVKPIWLIVLINEIRADNNSADKDSNRISLLLIGSFTLILILMALVRYHFRKLRSQIAKHPIPFFNRLKTFVIWIYFFHSLEVITYSFLEYKFVFSNIINSIENNSKLNTTINLLFLNWFMNVCYLFTSLFLVVTYHFPNLEIKIFKMLGIKSPYIKKTKRNFRNFIRKKTFFFTVTLSIGHIFFEYDWFCTPPFISIVFNTILTTVLTRSIASFFSNNGEIKSIHKRMEEKDKVFAHIQPKDIAKVKHFYNDDRSGKLEKYSVDPTIMDGHICVYIKDDKDDKDHGTKRYKYYFYVAFDGESVYLIDLDLGPIDKVDKDEIRCKIKNKIYISEECQNHYCEVIERKKRDIINGEEIKGRVLVNMLETGFLNYIIYSHRTSNTDEKEINRNNSTTDNDKSKRNSIFTILRINFIIALILTLCALCALYALFVFNNECYYIIIIMAICGLFAVFVLFKLSDDKDAKDDKKLASPV